jgi:hypothetical protein
MLTPEMRTNLYLNVSGAERETPGYKAAPAGKTSLTANAF